MNDGGLNTDYPLSWLILGVIVAAAVAFLYYFRDKTFKGIGILPLLLMGALRFAGVFLIILLLIGFNFKEVTEQEEPPVIVLVQDNSLSVINDNDTLQFVQNYHQKLSNLSADLEEQFEVVNYNFDEKVNDGLSTEINGKSTDLANVFSTIHKKYVNRNLGAIILATDGNYNKGIQPEIPLGRMPFVPVYAIALGDTAKLKDTRIVDVEHNEVAFYQNKFPVKVFLEANKINPPKNVTLSCWNKGKKVFAEPINWENSDDFKTIDFELKADQLGVMQFELRLDTLNGENNVKNNIRSFYIEVVDARQNILIASSAPHPDISTIYQSLLKKQGYGIEMIMNGEKPKKKIGAYDLVIFHTPKKNNWSQDLITNARSLWIIGSPQTDFNMLNQMNLGFSVTGVRGSDNIFPSFNNGFSAFQIDEKVSQLQRQLPPLQSPFGAIKVGAGANTVAFQRLGNIVKEDPLWFSVAQGDKKIGVLLGAGLWRWRLYNQKAMQSTHQIEQLIGQWVQFLALKTNKSRFKVQIETMYDDQAAIEVFAELFDDAFERTTNGEVSLQIKGPDYDRNFSMVGYNDRFKSELGRLNPGQYSWTAEAVFNGQRYNKKGTFVVQETYLEQQQKSANHQLLRNIVAQNGGQVTNLQNSSSLVDVIGNSNNISTIVHEKFSWKDLLDRWWWMLIVALLFFVEWFLRKRWGAI